MLKIDVPDTELYNSEKGEFVQIKGQTLVFEHSLVSISKWEARFHKPFLSSDKSREELIEYVKYMTITQNVNDDVYLCMTEDVFKQISDYIEDPMTATWFSEDKNDSKNDKAITSELIYYYMTALNIPFECQKWHFNRLLTLIKVCSEENKPKKKMKKSDITKRYAAINAKRRKALKSKG